MIGHRKSTLLPNPYLYGNTVLLNMFMDFTGQTATINSEPRWAKRAAGARDAMYFDGTDDYVSLPDSAKWVLGTGDFTFDIWCTQEAGLSTESSISFFNQYADANNLISIYLYRSSTATVWLGAKIVSGGVTTLNINQAITEVTGTPQHYAIVRSGTDFYLFQNGVSLGSPLSSSATFPDIGAAVIVAQKSGTTGAYYLSGFRLIKKALWTSTFYPPWTLAHYARQNDASRVSFLPFGVGTPYGKYNSDGIARLVGNPTITSVAKENTKVGVFNGAAKLTIPASSTFDFGSGDFCIHMWAKPTSASTQYTLIDYWSGTNDKAYKLEITSGGLVKFWWSTDGSAESSVTAVTAVTAGAWVHIAVQRYDGNVRIFLNGVDNNSAAIAGSIFNRAGNLTVGSLSGDTVRFTGSLSYVWIASAAMWKTNFVPPMFDHAYVVKSSTSLLLKLAGLSTDSSTNRHTVTNTSVTFTYEVFFYMSFDGSNDEIVIADNTFMELGSNDFTIDFWYWSPDLLGDNLLLKCGASGSNFSFAVRKISQLEETGSNRISFFYSTNGSAVTELQGLWTYAASQWYHVAITREGTNLRFYIDGVQIDTTKTISGTLYNSTANGIIGGVVSGWAARLNGRLSNFRIVNGEALWTGTSFVPPKF